MFTHQFLIVFPESQTTARGQCTCPRSDTFGYTAHYAWADQVLNSTSYGYQTHFARTQGLGPVPPKDAEYTLTVQLMCLHTSISDRNTAGLMSALITFSLPSQWVAHPCKQRLSPSLLSLHRLGAGYKRSSLHLGQDGLGSFQIPCKLLALIFHFPKYKVKENSSKQALVYFKTGEETVLPFLCPPFGRVALAIHWWYGEAPASSPNSCVGIQVTTRCRWSSSVLLFSDLLKRAACAFFSVWRAGMDTHLSDTASVYHSRLHFQQIAEYNSFSVILDISCARSYGDGNAF